MRLPGTTRVSRLNSNSMGASLKMGDRLRAKPEHQVSSGQVEAPQAHVGDGGHGGRSWWWSGGGSGGRLICV
jgi:hypothetical protein